MTPILKLNLINYGTFNEDWNSDLITISSAIGSDAI